MAEGSGLRPCKNSDEFATTFEIHIGQHMPLINRTSMLLAQAPKA